MIGIGKHLPRIHLGGNKALLRDRVKAWWEGYELVEQAPQRRAMDLGLDHDVRYERDAEFWETSRLLLVQEVWGEGFLSPGGAGHMGAYPWSIQDYQNAFADLHLDIRVTEDITESFQHLVIQGWAGYISKARKTGILDEMAPALVDEVEIWTRRMQAIDSGGIKVCRMHVMKGDTENLMSDW